ncbi:hypothetical protein CW748_17020 [Alteromonadales bacterium alter-6D02]|nr:hypothetical protein CW748_17020 [Alteromonadales bacterium alter-6D02]
MACSTNSNQPDQLNASDWRYDVDPHGSVATLDEKLVKEDGIWIKFNRVPRVDKFNNSWIELIYDLPSKTLGNSQQVTIEYKSSQPLIVKLSQKDYGKDGDNSFAHYQTKVPAATTWSKQTVSFDSFQRPSWTPNNSPDVGIVPENVSAIYFVPDLTDKLGGEAVLEIKSILLLN